ncbi:neuropeptide CCHamide-2 receptor [Bactrocera dorsalis]|uniref:Neuropeptide CCHamide-2 receptor n=1 Tax=Bactrocera dorsalis TaxID=27457 RepID=A0A6I9V8B6_BACDO|nr:neuropeptide CCHamide-2 receptor [Bactrocera dorsalis]XP_049309900.1 neuropeptide CCHamide-2 receptor [Bactrocera dorsalis]
MFGTQPASGMLVTRLPWATHISTTTSRSSYFDIGGPALASAIGRVAASTSLEESLRNKSSFVGAVWGDDADIDPATDYVPPSQRPETYIITVLFALIFIVGVLGNGTLVIIFFRHRSMRNIPNTYILSLALADLLVITICVPLASIVYTQESWNFGAEMCRISESFKDISIGVSIFTLTALSGERYFAIVNPLRKLQTRPLTVFTASMIWIVAILLAAPSFIVSDLQEIHIPPSKNSKNLTIVICSPFGRYRPNYKSYSKYTVISKAIIYYLLPLFIIGALYILMAKRLRTSAREMPGEALGMQSRSQARARRYVARMVVSFVVIFFGCFFPYHVFELWFHLNPTAVDDFDDFWHAVRIIGFCASFLHSCVNPVALYCVSGVFRQHFKRYLCCLCIKRQPHIRQHSTATGVMDTSVMSMRRSTVSNYNRASMHINSNRGGSNGGGGSAEGGSSTSTNLQRQASMPLHHSVTLQNNGAGGGTHAAGDKR